jgi:hypothetical protein
VTWDEEYLGAIGPFAVSIPWWAEVEPVVAHLSEALGVPVLVLRLLQVEGGEGSRDGHVTYHVAALERPAPGLMAERPVDHAVLTGPEELRSPWARLEGIRELLAWASDTLSLPSGIPDRRTPVIVGQIRALLGGRVARELAAWEVSAAHGLLSRFPMLDDCGLPDTVVHGDFHPGNWRSDGGPPVLVDFADAHFGNPVLDGLRVCDFLPEAKRPVAARAWIDAWTSRIPGCDPVRALSIAEPLAHLIYAVRYQEFLDGIEPAERIYHLGDPAASIRAALGRQTGRLRW